VSFSGIKSSRGRCRAGWGGRSGRRNILGYARQNQSRGGPLSRYALFIALQIALFFAATRGNMPVRGLNPFWE